MEIITDIRDRHHLSATLTDGTVTITMTLNVRDARRLAAELEITAGEVQRRNKQYRRSRDRQYDLPLPPSQGRIMGTLPDNTDDSTTHTPIL